MVLKSRPRNGSAVDVLLQDNADLRLEGWAAGAPRTLHFEPSNWDKAQTVRVRAVDDAVDEGSAELRAIEHRAHSNDTFYASLRGKSLQ